jgi:hypothetical protein
MKICFLLLLAAGCHDPVPPRIEVVTASASDGKQPVLRASDGTLKGVSPLFDIHIGLDRPLAPAQLRGRDDGHGAQIVEGLVQLVWEGAPADSREILVSGALYSDRAGPVTGNEGRPTISLYTGSYVPSGARLRLHLDRTRMVSLDGAALEGPDDVFVETTPFEVGIREDSAVIASHQAAWLVTSNRGAFDFARHVTVSMAGAPLDVLVRDAHPRQIQFLMLGPGSSGYWPGPGRYQVTVGADAADDHGVKLGAPASLSFEVR